MNHKLKWDNDTDTGYIENEEYDLAALTSWKEI